MDELESELRTLDREIAQFVLEAFQREAPEALRAQLAAALTEGLKPLHRSLESIGIILAEARGDIARSARASAGQAEAIQSDLGARARNGEEQAERRAFELQQAMERLAKEVILARREIRDGHDATASAPGAGRPEREPAPTDDFRSSQGAFGEFDASESRPAWWRRNGPWLAGGGAVLIIAAGLAAAILWPRGSPGPAPVAREAPAVAGTDGPPAAGSIEAAQEGFARVVGQVSSSWSGERRKVALEALCGPGGASAPCPTFQDRWLAKGRSPKDAQAALSATLAILSESDGCKAPGDGERRPDAAAGADPTAALQCILTEAGRAKSP